MKRLYLQIKQVIRSLLDKHFYIDLLYALNGKFRNEHAAVRAGIKAHTAGLGQSDRGSLSFFLRRSVHRIEKGLIMHPRRDVFAIDYIAQAVEAYEGLSRENDRLDEKLLMWASGILDIYFETTASHPVRDAAEKRYQEVRSGYTVDVSAIAPLGGGLDIDPDEIERVKRLAQKRRSVRWYLQKPVPREAIDLAVEIASESPSACNRQAFEFLVYDDPALVAKIANIPKGCSNFSHNFPCVVLIIGKQNAFSHERDRHVVYVDGSLAAMSFQYALTAQGIGSCCINWPALGYQDDVARKAAGLKDYEQPIMLISVGYPDPERLVPISVKKPVDELRTYNRSAAN